MAFILVSAEILGFSSKLTDFSYVPIIPAPVTTGKMKCASSPGREPGVEWVNQLARNLVDHQTKLGAGG